MQEVIDVLMIKLCAEEGASPQKVFFYFVFFAVFFIILAILEKNLNKSVGDIKNSL